MLKILSDAGTKVQGICSQAKLKIQATFSSSIAKIKECAKIVFAACANAHARICGLGQAGHTAIILVARGSIAKLDGTLRKAPKLAVEAQVKKEEVAETVVEASAPVVVEENKPAPVLSKMERAKQAVKAGGAAIAKAMHDHPRISAAVIAAGMFGVGAALQARAARRSEQAEIRRSQAEMDAWMLLTDSSAGEILAFDKTPEFREDPSFKAHEFARTFDNDSAVNEPFVGAFKIPDAYMTYLSNEHFETANSVQKEVEGAHLRYPVSVGANNRWKWQAAEARHADIEPAAQRKAHAEDVRKFLDSIQEPPTESTPPAPEPEPTFAFEGPGERKPDPVLEKAIAEEFAIVEAQNTVAAFHKESTRETIFGAAKQDLAPYVARKEQVERMNSANLSAAWAVRAAAKAAKEKLVGELKEQGKAGFAAIAASKAPVLPKAGE